MWKLKDSNLKYAAGILALFVVICFKMSVFGFELLFAVLLFLALDFRLNDYISVKFSKIIIYFSDMLFLRHSSESHKEKFIVLVS